MRRRAMLWRAIVVVTVVGGAAAVALVTATGVRAANSGVNVEAACTSGIYCFSPSSTSVTSGDTVTWTNTTSAPHTATLCTPAACSGAPANSTGCDSFDVSIASGSGNTASHTFTGTGTCTYYCKVHGYSVMHAVVTVAAAATPAPSATATVPTPGTGASLPLDVVAALAIVGGVVLALALVGRRQEP